MKAVRSFLAAGLLAASALAQPSSSGAEHIWFEDLVGTVAPAPAVQADVVRYLTAMALGPEASEWPASLAGDRAPRMIFLTLGDGVRRAWVVRGAGRGLTAAIRPLRRAVRRLAEDGLEVRFARVDLVTEVRPRKVDLGRALALDRSLYGLAFERRLDLAFLADEVVTHTLIDSDQRLRLRNVRKRPEANAARLLLEDLEELDRIRLFRFATAAYFSDGDAPIPLYRGHRSFAELEPRQLLHHAELAGHYLVRAVEPSGRFVYSYLPKTDEVKEKYNALRHCGTVYSMLELYEVTGDDALLAAAKRALSYLERELLGRCRVGGTETTCVVEDGEVKLGGNALAIVALAQHAAVTGETKYLELIDELGHWILLTQSTDGEFKIHKQFHPGGEVSDFVSDYYPGEALLALVRRPEPDPAWLDAAERGARWLIDVRDHSVATHELNHDHWLLYALNELHRLRPDPAYPKHAARISEAILALQRRQAPVFPDWLGSYYRPPRSTPTATRSEGLGAAYLMMRDAGHEERAAELRAAVELGVRFQLQTQFLPEKVLYLEDPARALGGFHRSLTNYEIRIDYVQHNISALLQLRHILFTEKRRDP